MARNRHSQAESSTLDRRCRRHRPNEAPRKGAICRVHNPPALAGAAAGVLYSEKQLEDVQTHDPLWDAAQMQMVNTGWMHNYLRMHWAKKILEWTPSPAAAHQIAVHLNDKYELDGRDPNGYAGIAWSIVGKFDRPWFECPIFGQIRYMSAASTGKKFDSKKYIEQNLQPGMFK